MICERGGENKIELQRGDVIDGRRVRTGRKRDRKIDVCPWRPRRRPDRKPGGGLGNCGSTARNNCGYEGDYEQNTATT